MAESKTAAKTAHVTEKRHEDTDTKTAATEEVKLQEDARKAAQERLDARREKEPLLGGMDANTASLGWTVQQGPEPEGDAPVPGNVVLVHELPDLETQLLAGIDPVQANAGIVVAANVAEQRRLRGVSDEDNAARLENRKRAAKLSGFDDADVKNDHRIVQDEAIRDEKAGETVRAAIKRVADADNVTTARGNAERGDK